MTLIHPDGRAMAVHPLLWRRALQRAAAHGWRPAGTLPPPIRWDGAEPAWHGQYEPAAGQEVSRADARALGEALGRAAAEDESGDLLRELEHFCRAGGFLLCPAPEAMDSLIALAAHVRFGQPVQTRQSPAPHAAP